jgi:hypothetical protein
MTPESDAFYKRMKSFVVQNPDMTFIIYSAQKDERQSKSRDAWLTYLKARGLDSTYKTWVHILKSGGKAIAVPAEFPEFFDISYEPPKHTVSFA